MSDKRKTVLFIIYYTIVFGTSAVYGSYIGLYYLRAGFSVFQIGTLQAIGPLSSIIIQPIWASFCDRVKYKTTVLRIILIGSMSVVLLYPFVSHYAYMFLITVGYMAFFTSVFPMGDSIAVDYLTRHGLRFDIVRLSGTIGYTIVALCTSSYMKSHLTQMFYFVAAFFAVAIVASCFLPREQSAARVTHKAKLSEVLSNRKILFILLFIVVMSTSMSFNGSFLSVYIKKLHFSTSFVGIAFCCSAASEIPILLVITKFIKKYGTIRLLLFSGLAMAARMLLCFAAVNVGMLLMAQLLQGFSYMVMYYCTVTFINEEMPMNLKSTGQGIIAMAQSGFGAVIGTIGGGWISNTHGIRGTYAIYGLFLLSFTLISIAAYVIRKTGRFRGRKAAV